MGIMNIKVLDKVINDTPLSYDEILDNSNWFVLIAYKFVKKYGHLYLDEYTVLIVKNDVLETIHRKFA